MIARIARKSYSATASPSRKSFIMRDKSQFSISHLRKLLQTIDRKKAAQENIKADRNIALARDHLFQNPITQIPTINHQSDLIGENNRIDPKNVICIDTGFDRINQIYTRSFFSTFRFI